MEWSWIQSGVAWNGPGYNPVLHGLVLNTIGCCMESLGYGTAWRALDMVLHREP
jgi:hypothetical protein